MDGFGLVRAGGVEVLAVTLKAPKVRREETVNAERDDAV
jgi:hypothetical protein